MKVTVAVAGFALVVSSVCVAAQASATPYAADDRAVAPALPRAAGLIVKTGLSADALASSVDLALTGLTGISDISPGVNGTKVISFTDSVAGNVAEDIASVVGSTLHGASVEPDYVLTAADASPVPVNDPLFARQYNVWDSRLAGGGFSVRAPVFWQRTPGVPSVRVALLDTGYLPHPDLNGAWTTGYDFVSAGCSGLLCGVGGVDPGDGNGRDSDPTDPGDACGSDSDSWHGTHVAGIVGARANNGTGVVGVAPGVTLESARVLGKCGGNTSDIAAAITWASGGAVPDVPANQYPAQVINMSFGGAAPCGNSVQTAIDGARSRGVVVVAAAGNEHKDAATFTPANCVGVLSVGSTNDRGELAPYSNRGPSVDISAPGGDSSVGTKIISTVNNGGYAEMEGTSMASPVVAGGAALLFSVGLNSAQVESVLLQARQPSTTSGTAGILNLGYADFLLKWPVTATFKLPKSVKKSKRAKITVNLRSQYQSRPSGTIAVYDGSKRLVSKSVTARRKGNLTFTLPKFKSRGIHHIQVLYSGSKTTFRPASSSVKLIKVK